MIQTCKWNMEDRNYREWNVSLFNHIIWFMSVNVQFDMVIMALMKCHIIQLEQFDMLCLRQIPDTKWHCIVPRIELLD